MPAHIDEYDEFDDFDGEYETITIPFPVCPICEGDSHIYCVECGEPTEACSCLYWQTDWYCMNCQEMFTIDWPDDDDAEIVTEETAKEEREDGSTVVTAADGTELIYTVDGKIFYRESGKEVKCYCDKPKAYACIECKVHRQNLDQRWEYWAPPDSKKNQNQKDSGKAWTSSHGYVTSFKLCRHYCTEVKLKETTVWASSLNDSETRNDIPDFGLYADWAWRPYWRQEHIDWSDFGLPYDLDIAAEQIIDAYDKATAGWRVEVGCIGGHGRTGTILACMAVLDGMTPERAIKHVRRKYCHQAIETNDQEWYISWFEAKIKGKPAPARPVYHQSDKFGGATEFCLQKNHFKAWRLGAKECPWLKNECSFWEKDVIEFETNDSYVSGYYDSHTKGSLGEPKQDYIVIDGFKIPKPKRGQTQHGEHCLKGGNRACDYCRYVALAPWGVGVAFLEPVGSQASDEYVWDDVLGWQWKQLVVKS